MNIFEWKNAQLLTEFDRYVIEHPHVADDIPSGALVAMEVEDDRDFNEWSRQMMRTQAEPGQQIVFFVRKRTLQPNDFEEDLRTALLNKELRDLSREEEVHMDFKLR